VHGPYYGPYITDTVALALPTAWALLVCDFVYFVPNVIYSIDVISFLTGFFIFLSRFLTFLNVFLYFANVFCFVFIFCLTHVDLQDRANSAEYF